MLLNTREMTVSLLKIGVIGGTVESAGGDRSLDVSYVRRATQRVCEGLVCEFHASFEEIHG